VLATWAALLRRPEVGPEIARRLCDDLSAIVADVEPAFAPTQVDLCAIAVAGVRAIDADARRKGLRIVQRVAALPVWVMGDGVRLAEVVSNLLRNALAFTGPGDTITVEVSERHGAARLVVADTGGGISAAFLPHVFEKFSQEARRARGGRGLGLYVVRNLVELPSVSRSEPM